VAISDENTRAALAARYVTGAKYAALHDGTPTFVGSEVRINDAYARGLITWDAFSSDVRTGTASLPVTSGFKVQWLVIEQAADSPAQWDRALLPEQTFSSAGTYNITATYQQL